MLQRGERELVSLFPWDYSQELLQSNQPIFLALMGFVMGPLPCKTDRPLWSNTSDSIPQESGIRVGRGEVLITLAEQCYDPLGCAAVAFR